MTDEDESLGKSFVIFGTDVGRIPCFRSTLLFGIGSGLATGLASFMLTSKGRLSSHVGYSAFVVTTLCYWVNCRYKYAQQKFNVTQILQAGKLLTVNEGTPVDRQKSGTSVEDMPVDATGKLHSV